MNPRIAGLAALLSLLATPGHADTAIRVGDHPGFGRVVVDIPSRIPFETVREGDRLLVVLKGAGPVQAPPRMPRNVASIQGGMDSATILLAPGAEVRVVRLGERLVIDAVDRSAASRPLLDQPPTARDQRPDKAARPNKTLETPPDPPRPEKPPTANANPAAAAKPSVTAAASAPRVPVAETPLPAPEHPTSPAPTATHPEAPPPQPATPPTPQRQAAAPNETSAEARVEPPPQPVILPADATTGAAAFRRGALGVVVLDRRAIPPGSTARPAESGSGSLFQLPLPPGMALRLSRVPAGWSVEPISQAEPAAMQPVVAPAGTLFPMARPGRVVTVLDPISGGPLMVGTSLDPGTAPAQSTERRTPAFALLPSWQGVVVEPASDAADLRAVQAGFLLSGGPLSAIAPDLPLTRRFDLPDGDTTALANRLKAQLVGAATALPRARARERLAAVATMIALGLGAEAQAMAQLAVADDPQTAADAGSQALIAIAAVLAGRPEEADALNDTRLDGSDEIELWRGLRDRRLARNTPAARTMADKAPLALAYPATLGRLLVPDMAEAAVETGTAFPEQRLTPYAKAVLLERRGKTTEAIAAFEALANGQDRLDQVRGAIKTAELRLAAGQLSPLDAAAVMERQSFAWRGDGREAALRMRAAELRGQAGEWRGALDALREIEATFPDQKAAVRARMAGVMQTMLAAEGGALSPLDVVLLAMEHADAVMGGDVGAALSRLLAVKLSALDLPARAIPVLQGLMRGVPPGEARATLGGRLAQVLLDGDEPDAALAALDASAADALPAPLLETRALLRARLQAALGDPQAAAAGLAAQGTAAADDLRAAILARAGDWPGAMAALAALAARTIPPKGPLDPTAQDILLRQATAATQAGDAAALKILAASAERLTPPRDALFRVLTAAPVTSVADLPRASRELRLARALPQQPREVTR